MLKSEKLLVPVTSDIKLHIKKIYKESSLPPVVLIHGSMENGKIFYSKSLKGFAPYLAQNGFTVYVVDLRGKGESHPKISRDFNFGQADVINDLVHVYEYIQTFHPNDKQIWGSHSWGGVLVNCFLLRHPEYIKRTEKLFHFATKRSISVRSIQKYINIDIAFKRLFTWQAYLEGYVSPRFFGFDSEARNYHVDVAKWVSQMSFVDPSDRFDYAQSALKHKLPQSLFIAGINDPYLGNPVDVRRFMQECNVMEHDYLLLSKANGRLHDYGHNDMVTHPDGPNDHFPLIKQWLQR